MRLIYILFLGTQIFCFSQNSNEYITDNVINSIEKNIIAKRILDYNQVKYYYDININDLILDEGISFYLNFNKIDFIKFPNKNFVFYNVVNQTGKLIDKKRNEIIYKVSSHQTYPKEEYVIGINKKDEHYIYFITGNILKTKIAHEYDLNIDDASSFFSYLKIKLYNYDIVNVQYVKKRKKYMLFRAFSNYLDKVILIKVNREDFDNLQMKEEKSGWTEQGDYSWDKKKW